MDAEWVGRAGILAEAVSFVLIAPEILGAPRLLSTQQTVEKILRRILKPSRIWADVRYMPLLPGWIPDDPDVDFLTGVATTVVRGAYFAVVIPVMVTGVLQGHAEAVFWIAIVVAVISFNLETAAVLLARWKGSRGVIRSISYALAIPAMPWSWTVAGLYAMAFVALRLGARGGVALLSGPGGLRALVFGTGVILLFGGLGTQFYATF